MASVTRAPEAIATDAEISAYGKARATVKGAPLSPEEVSKIDAYWRASLYLSLGMLYLKDNPLLQEPLRLEHVKSRLLGHWGSDAGQSFTYIHFNRLIKKYDLNAIFISGPGHGAPDQTASAAPRPANPGRPGPRGSGSLIPVEGELSSETVAYSCSHSAPISAEVKHPGTFLCDAVSGLRDRPTVILGHADKCC